MLTKRETAADHIRKQIETGKYPAGTVLTGVDLQEELGMSRGTISNALYDLGEEGVIYSRARNASWVVAGKPQESFQATTELDRTINELDAAIAQLSKTREGLVTTRAAIAQLS